MVYVKVYGVLPPEPTKLTAGPGASPKQTAVVPDILALGGRSVLYSGDNMLFILIRLRANNEAIIRKEKIPTRKNLLVINDGKG